MAYKYDVINKAHQELEKTFASLDDKNLILKNSALRDLFAEIKNIPGDDRAAFGAEINNLKNEITRWLADSAVKLEEKSAIDVTAPFAPNTTLRLKTLNASAGSKHPIVTEIDKMLDIYYRMGFTAEDSRLIDDDYHMFESLNFPEDHPARDDYDTFITTEGLIAPAHTSTMQNRVLQKYRKNLDNNEPIAVVIPGRVFRNEDIDVTHEHTFYQFEGVFVGKNINVGNLIAVLRSFMSEYFGQDLKAKIQPFYFPFTEPSFEFSIERPEVLRKGNTEADMWLELLGCGMINPNVLKMAGIDPDAHTGFAWGGGIERLVMMKHNIEDIRYFESGKLEFLRQF